MLEKFTKTINKIAKFENYYILRQEPNAVIVAARPMIYQLVRYAASNFNPRDIKVDKKLPVFFMITAHGKEFNNILIKEFIKKELPIFYLEATDTKLSIEDLQQRLSDFIFNTFHKV